MLGAGQIGGGPCAHGGIQSNEQGKRRPLLVPDEYLRPVMYQWAQAKKTARPSSYATTTGTVETEDYDDSSDSDDSLFSDDDLTIFPDESVSVRGLHRGHYVPPPKSTDSQSEVTVRSADAYGSRHANLTNPCEKLDFIERMPSIDGLHHYRLKLDADKIVDDCQVMTAFGPITLPGLCNDGSRPINPVLAALVRAQEPLTPEGTEAILASEAARAQLTPEAARALEKTSIINMDGRWPQSCKDPERFRNGSFEVKKSPISGFGVFAIRDLLPYETVLVEKQAFVANATDLYDQIDNLTPEQEKAFRRLVAFERNPMEDRTAALFKTNSFNVPGGGALFLLGSRFNHACRSRNNVEYRIDLKGLICFTTKKTVPAGTELTIRYAAQSYDLFRAWGFRCTCGGCTPITDEEIMEIKMKGTDV
ncbi:Uu.00g030930.m01.CDS01 [Anthostomella pinea]|uniref:Uu.00g030930.m01.CDS01 n=1 Tax=Anthostomella pinea TaxID=933095 RepID=A0AAI8V8F1_9PEZI|nr:Uu.00g030930.m01.CDS01 [Anthostomella pinea]